MSYRLGWYQRQTHVVEIILEGDITFEEVAEAHRRVLRLIEAMDSPVTYVLNLAQVCLPPNVLNTFPTMAQHPIFSHPAINHRVLIVGKNCFAERLAHIFAALYHRIDIVEQLPNTVGLSGASELSPNRLVAQSPT
ncbi:MAG: hypothetical protein GYB68_01030 [Chloroflexi bacterium]|nr:hypothetical protein [Chloroflexota bacterium]